MGMRDPRYPEVVEAIVALWPGAGGLLGLDAVYGRVLARGTPMTAEQFAGMVDALANNDLIALGGTGPCGRGPLAVNSEAIAVQGERCINGVSPRLRQR